MTSKRSSRPTRRTTIVVAMLLLAPAAARAEVPASIGINQPVASAMRQIVPPGHVVRFGPGVSPQTHVDWHSNGPWQETMQSALASKGLRAITRGTEIEVVSNNQAAQAAPARPNRTTMRRAARRNTDDAGDLAPTAVTGMPQLTPAYPLNEQIPYPNAPAGTSSPTAPNLPPPTYAPRQSYAVPPDVAAPYPARALQRPPVPNYVPPVAETRYQVAGVWHAEANAYLDEVINRWCNQAGGGWALTRNRPTCIDLKTDLHYRLVNSITLNDRFEDAVVQLVNAIHAPIAPYVRVHSRSFVVELTDSEHLSQSADE